MKDGEVRSNNERKVVKYLTEHGVDWRYEPMLAIDTWPWKQCGKNQKPPFADFYIEASGLIIEVKGYMTIEVLYRNLWYINNIPNYYLLQMSEREWPLSFEYQMHEIISGKIPSKEAQLARLYTYINRKRLMFNPDENYFGLKDMPKMFYDTMPPKGEDIQKFIEEYEKDENSYKTYLEQLFDKNFIKICQRNPNADDADYAKMLYDIYSGNMRFLYGSISNFEFAYKEFVKSDEYDESSITWIEDSYNFIKSGFDKLQYRMSSPGTTDDDIIDLLFFQNYEV
jgi:hypothetical protein